MSAWREKSEALKRKLALRTDPVAFKRLEKASELDQIPGLKRIDKTHVFCQLPFMARVGKMIVGATSDSKLLDRCKRLHALLPTTEESMKAESEMFSKTWFASPEEAMRQQGDYVRMPPGEAIVLAPLGKASFDPDVISVFGNPAQIMMILCGLQKLKYEQFHFTFIGEGACSEQIAKCYVTGKPSLAIPCFGERAMGQVADDEIVLALPPAEIDRVLQGLDILKKVGFTYPIVSIGGISNPISALSQFYSVGQK